jgi:hypothetical protein
MQANEELHNKTKTNAHAGKAKRTGWKMACDASALGIKVSSKK